jgi:hypothetical protein
VTLSRIVPGARMDIIVVVSLDVMECLFLGQIPVDVLRMVKRWVLPVDVSDCGESIECYFEYF